MKLELTRKTDLAVRALRTLRTRLARERGVPPYVILHNRTIQEIARLKPADRPALLAVHGFGRSKLEDIGDAVLAAVRLEPDGANGA